MTAFYFLLLLMAKWTLARPNYDPSDPRPYFDPNRPNQGPPVPTFYVGGQDGSTLTAHATGITPRPMTRPVTINPGLTISRMRAGLPPQQISPRDMNARLQGHHQSWPQNHQATNIQHHQPGSHFVQANRGLTITDPHGNPVNRQTLPAQSPRPQSTTTLARPGLTITDSSGRIVNPQSQSHALNQNQPATMGRPRTGLTITDAQGRVVNPRQLANRQHTTGPSSGMAPLTNQNLERPPRRKLPPLTEAERDRRFQESLRLKTEELRREAAERKAVQAAEAQEVARQKQIRLEQRIRKEEARRRQQGKQRKALQRQVDLEKGRLRQMQLDHQRKVIRQQQEYQAQLREYKSKLARHQAYVAQQRKANTGGVTTPRPHIQNTTVRRRLKPIKKFYG